MIITVKMFQYKNVETVSTLKFDTMENQKSQMTEWLRIALQENKDVEFISNHEMHILRILRHIREPLENLPQLDPRLFKFFFDTQNSNELIENKANTDGDFYYNVPGGFFTARFTELF